VAYCNGVAIPGKAPVIDSPVFEAPVHDLPLVTSLESMPTRTEVVRDLSMH
jgi:hypothetical protein